MKNMYVRGSSLLTVVIIITLTSLVCINVWRITVVAFDISLKKQHHEQMIQALSSVMLWSLDVCKNNFDVLYNYIKTNKQGVHVEIPLWKINHQDYRLDLVFKSEVENVISITEHLFIKTVVCGNVRCMVTKETIKDSVFYKVSDWSTHAL
jgi:hypothetical protein